MKKIIYLVPIFLSLLAGLGYLVIKQKKSDVSGYRIAIFYPASHPSMDEIVLGIKETMINDGTNHYTFDIYNANGNKTLLRAQAEEIIQGNYACICTIGAICTQTIFELAKKRGVTPPLVFCAVDDPIKMGIAKNLESSGTNATGSIIQDKFDNQFSILLKIKPTTKRVLFVYDPAHGTGLETVRKKIEEILKAKGIELKTVEVYQPNEIQQKVTPMLDGIDVIFVYTDHTVVSGIDSLITLGNRYGITLYTSELNSGDKGAALSYGVQEYEHGREAAKKALAIIEEKKSPSQVSITPVKDFKLKVNTSTMNKQGLPLSKDELEQIRKTGGIII